MSDKTDSQSAKETTKSNSKGSSKKVKIIIGTALAVILILVGLWIWIIPASAETACAHAVDVVVDEFKDEFDQELDGDAKDDIESECIDDEESYAERKGIFDVKERRSCLLDAESLDDLEECTN